MTDPTESLEPQGDQAMAQASAWIARLGGDVSGEDGVEFDAWLEASAGNRTAYRRALALTHGLDARAGDVLAALDALEAPAPARPPAGRAYADRPRASRWRWGAPAGGLALAAGLAIAVMPAYLAGPAAVSAYATAKGEHRHLQLADGTLVDLDAGTRLSVSISKTE